MPETVTGTTHISPTPWRIRTRQDGRLAITGGFSFAPAGAGGFLHVCDLSGDKHHDAANARLIAAAPDYDSVAREMAAEHDAGQPISEALWQKLYYVIAKATGEE